MTNQSEKAIIYDALTVAHYAVISAWKKGILLNVSKLQCLLYYLQAAYLVKTGLPCFCDIIEAGQNGPEIPSISKAFGHCLTKSIAIRDVEGIYPAIAEKDKKRIDLIVKSGLNLSGKEIQKQMPWITAYSNNRCISWDSLVKYFEIVN